VFLARGGSTATLADLDGAGITDDEVSGFAAISCHMLQTGTIGCGTAKRGGEAGFTFRLAFSPTGPEAWDFVSGALTADPGVSGTANVSIWPASLSGSVLSGPSPLADMTRIASFTINTHDVKAWPSDEVSDLYLAAGGELPLWDTVNDTITGALSHGLQARTALAVPLRASPLPPPAAPVGLGMVRRRR
jgi:hypothetical protein